MTTKEDVKAKGARNAASMDDAKKRRRVPSYVTKQGPALLNGNAGGDARDEHDEHDEHDGRGAIDEAKLAPNTVSLNIVPLGEAHPAVAGMEGNIRLDIGCGTNKRPGHIGIDKICFDGVDIVLDAGWQRWPFLDGTVKSVVTSHFLEHLTAGQRVHFVNELYRVLEVGGTAEISVPHWASCRAYGDPTHQWPPVSEFWFYYLDRAWRKQNAPHTDLESVASVGGAKAGDPLFACDFMATWGYAMSPDLAARAQDYQSFALANYKEAATDIVATLTKRG